MRTYSMIDPKSLFSELISCHWNQIYFTTRVQWRPLPERKILEPSSTSESEDDHDELPSEEHDGDDDDDTKDDDDDDEDYDSSESENKGTSDDESTATSPKGCCYVGIFS